MSDITVTELKSRLNNGEVPFLIDVREEHEHSAFNIGGLFIPLGTLPVQMSELGEEKDKELIFYCRSGKRSATAALLAKQQGYSNVRNLTGGMLAWKAEIDPSANVS